MFGGSTERKTQLYFRDDRKFHFRKLPLKYSCLVEMDGDRMKRGWKHFYGSEFAFSGYKGISADTVTLGFPRDIILDPYDKIAKGDDVSKKPDLKNPASLIRWIAKIAENMRHIYRAKRTVSTRMNPLDWIMIGIICVEALAWLIRYTTGG